MVTATELMEAGVRHWRATGDEPPEGVVRRGEEIRAEVEALVGRPVSEWSQGEREVAAALLLSGGLDEGDSMIGGLIFGLFVLEPA